ncbi:Hypothetical predicted protein [Olea europaea subsp. europaea]|uniref:Uncharacterized protein n=1 Tax=Olea europaea subsp. europaea TaxID=158383 RepID=A0A8S0QWA4_OLEEU|nr:Hypothetical predicted protein [Olea europaea subsp. europaea]
MNTYLYGEDEIGGHSYQNLKMVQKKCRNELTEAGVEVLLPTVNTSSESSQAALAVQSIDEGTERFLVHASYSGDDIEASSEISETKLLLDVLVESKGNLGTSAHSEKLLKLSSMVPNDNNKAKDSKNINELVRLSPLWTEGVLPLWTKGVLLLLKQAIECGSATVHGPKKLVVQRGEKIETSYLELKEAAAVAGTEITFSRRESERRPSRNGKMKNIKADFLNVVP